MKASKSEQHRAERFSAALDQRMQEPGPVPGPALRPDLVDPDDAELLDTAGKLAQLPALLGPVEPTLEQWVMRQVRVGGATARRRPAFRWAWAASGLAAVLVMALALSPLGQTAVASFLAVFDLGRTQVRVTPASAPAALTATVEARGRAVRQSMTLEEAQGRVSFAIPQPGYLPEGYHLSGVAAVTYPDLPAWVPQPFLVELVYGDGEGQQCTLRLYPISLGDRASIAGLNLEAAPIREVRDVEVNGQPGVLLRLGGDRTTGGLQELVWEQDDLILALSTGSLSEADLLQIARSIR